MKDEVHHHLRSFVIVTPSATFFERLRRQESAFHQRDADRAFDKMFVTLGHVGRKTASLNFRTPDDSVCVMRKTASLNFRTPDNLFVEGHTRFRENDNESCTSRYCLHLTMTI